VSLAASDLRQLQRPVGEDPQVPFWVSIVKAHARRTAPPLPVRPGFCTILAVKEVSIQELKKNLSAYVRRASEGERIVITRHHRPVALLGSASPQNVHRGKRFGRARLSPLLKNATRGRYLEVLADDRGIGEDAR
jgi:prevent-host-death family protein